MVRKWPGNTEQATCAQNMVARNSMFKNWVFTLNNPCNDELETLIALFELH